MSAAQLIAGVALILAPLVWLVAVVIRHLVRRIAEFTPEQEAYFDGQSFRAPQQLAVYLQEPDLTIAGYALFAGASVLLLPAVFGLARSAVVGRGWLASIGGLLVAVSLMARLYFSGVDLTAFELVDHIGLEAATKFVLAGYVDLSYGLWRIPVSLSAGSILGCLVLAIAAYRAGVFGLGRCLLLIWWGWTFMGVLKDSHLGTVLGGVALCLAMIPLGIGVLRGGNSHQTLQAPLGDGPSRCGETAGQDTDAHTYRGCRLAGGGHPLAAGHGGPGWRWRCGLPPEGLCWRIHTGDSAARS